MPRLFTGLEIPEHIAQRLCLIQARLHGARWISPENYHITLRFIGDVEDRVADEFAYALGSVPCPVFSLRLAGMGSFGGRKPRAIWADVENSDALMSLHRANEQAARLAGLPPEARNFTPHVTLARLRGTHSDEVARFLENFGDFASQPFEVSRFILFSSRPSRGGGPYAVEAEYPLQRIGE